MDKDKKKEISCTDCPCKKEDCKHGNLEYCECLGNVVCIDCGKRWESETRWRDYWYNTGDLIGSTHTWETVGVCEMVHRHHVAKESRRNDHCMKPGEGDWSGT